MENKKTRPSLPSTLYTEDYFLTACEGYEEFAQGEGAQLSRRLKIAANTATIEAGMVVLDVGCGRGEIVRYCAQLGADAFGIDYAAVAVAMTHDLITQVDSPGRAAIGQANAKSLPFPNDHFDRILLLDVVEHLYPWELHESLVEMWRVLKPDGRLIVHTAPNRWYDRYAYPLVRLARHLMGQGAQYPKNPREFGVAVNKQVHVNEQDLLSMRHTLRKAGFKGKIWLDSPPQNRDDGPIVAAIRHIAFRWPPYRWFFQREVFAIARKV